MTPAQKEALEGVVGRPLTAEEEPVIAAAVALRDDRTITTILSKDRKVLQQKYIGTGTILSKMAGKGGQFMDLLVEVGKVNRDAYWAMDLLKAGRFDIGDPASQTQLDGLAQLYPDFADGIHAVKATGQLDAPVSLNEISEVLNKLDRSET